MPSSWARWTTSSKSVKVPRSGWIAVWPPSGPPMAHGEPPSLSVAVSVWFGPLRAGGGMDLGWAAPRSTDGPRRADVAVGRSQRVVRPLAELAADRVDGREVDDVEAHLGDGGEAVAGALEAALAAGEQLVPGAEQG